MVDMPKPKSELKRADHATRFPYQSMMHNGRPRKLDDPEKIIQTAIDYTEWADANPMQQVKLFHNKGIIKKDTEPRMRVCSIEGLCLRLGVSDEAWRKNRDDPDSPVREAIKQAERIIFERNLAGASSDMLNASLIARYHKIADKTESTTVDATPPKADDVDPDLIARHVHPDDDNPLGPNRPLYSMEQIRRGVPFTPPPEND